MPTAGRVTPRDPVERQLLVALAESNQPMKADIDKAIKPVRKLREMLKSYPRDPSPDYVHNLRTQSRRLEATMHALFGKDDQQACKLLKTVKPLRKTSGKVRDMDVFIGKTFTLRSEPGAGPENGPDQECLITLAEHLAGLRRKHVQQLGKQVVRRGPKARKLLKRSIDRLRSMDRLKDASMPQNQQPDPVQELVAELEHWPKLHKQNLHEFRKEAKELRYMLQLSPEEDRAGIDAFGRVKDTAGDWHDWLELENVAREVLNPKTDGAMLKAIHKTMREKLRVALTAANGVRRRGTAQLAA